MNKMLFRKYKYPLIALFTASLSILNINCKDNGNSEINYNPNVLASKDYIYAEDIYFDIFNVFFQAVTDTGIYYHNWQWIENCSVQKLDNENVLHFHYGSVNRECPDGKFRRGTYYAYIDGVIFSEGSVANIVTDSLFVDDELVETQIEIRNLGSNITGKPGYTFKVTGGNITRDDTSQVRIIQFNSDFLISWQEGIFTDNHSDDLLFVTGSSWGKSSQGYDFAVTVQDTIYDYISCNWLDRGTHQIIVPSGDYTTGTIDYITEDDCNRQVNFYFNQNLFYDFLK